MDVAFVQDAQASGLDFAVAQSMPKFELRAKGRHGQIIDHFLCAFSVIGNVRRRLTRPREWQSP